MFTPILKSRLSALLLTAAVLVLVTSACSFYAPGFGKVTQVIDIRIPEAMLQQSSPRVTVGDHIFYDPLLDHVTRVELHDGYLRYIGTRTLPSGRLVPGSVDMYVGAKDDQLTAKIIAVDIPGIVLDDPLVTRINQEMKVEFSLAMASPDAELRFKEVQVKEDELYMKIQVTVRF